MSRAIGLRCAIAAGTLGTFCLAYAQFLHRRPSHDRWDVVIPLEMLTYDQPFPGRRFRQKRQFSNSVVYFLAYIANVHVPISSGDREWTAFKLQELGWSKHISPVYQSFLESSIPPHLTGYRRTYVCTLPGEDAGKYSRRHQVGYAPKNTGYGHIEFAVWIVWKLINR